MGKRTLRQSQTISPFGVGSIYDILGESLVACDISHWRGNGEMIDSPPSGLMGLLGVRNFKAAPPAPDFVYRSRSGKPVEYFRFPLWLFCQNCREMVFWKFSNENGQAPTCGKCGKKHKLVPMRFVSICSDGHLCDVPWDRWAHMRSKDQKQKQCHSQKLRFKSLGGAGGGLASLKVECSTCGASKTLDGITVKESLKQIGFRCPGKQPWQLSAKDQEDCEELPQVVQRGASNVYFPEIRSAIDIPPESNYINYNDMARRICNHEHYGVVASSPDGPIADHVMHTISDALHCSFEQVKRVVMSEAAEGQGDYIASISDTDIEAQEWHAFVTPREDQDPRDRFVTKHVEFGFERDGSNDEALESLRSSIDRVVIATRLREVRALKGFRRYSPDCRIVPADMGKGLDWLPALEVYGEGLFLSIDETSLKQWEQLKQVKKRAAIISKRRDDSIRSWLPSITPRFILLHTLSHLLIRQLTFECGYSSASLRERIYHDEDKEHAGLLIYTAAGDSEGTLGGLARQGEPQYFAKTVIAALKTAMWCSSDPICRESSGQGIESLNLAACHACGLIPETSCVYSNAMLDRTLVIGEEDGLGFFAQSMSSVIIT